MTAAMEEHINQWCDKNGRQDSNLEEIDQEGLKSLLARQSKGEITVMMTDKSGKFAMVTPEIYQQMGAIHT